MSCYENIENTFFTVTPRGVVMSTNPRDICAKYLVPTVKYTCSGHPECTYFRYYSSSVVLYWTIRLVYSY